MCFANVVALVDASIKSLIELEKFCVFNKCEELSGGCNFYRFTY